jgi:hypothetical protein
MKTTRKAVVFVLVALAPTSPAAACSLSPSVPGTPVRAEVAFTGTVTTATQTDPSNLLQTYRFSVDHVLKGDVAGTTLDVQSTSSASCGASFTVGERYLAFASVARASDRFLVEGVLATNLGWPNRSLASDVTIPRDALYNPAPGFLFGRSDLTPHQLVVLPTPRAWWLGGYDARSRGLLRILRREDGIAVVYRRGLRVTTRSVPEGPPAAATSRLRGVPAVFGEDDVTVFVGGQQIQISGKNSTLRELTQAVEMLSPANRSGQFAPPKPLPPPRPLTSGAPR